MLLLLLAGHVSMTQAQQLSIADFEIAPGSTQEVAVNLDNGSATIVDGLQVAIELPQGLTFVADSWAVTNRVPTAGEPFELVAHNPYQGNDQKLQLLLLKQGSGVSISGTDGAVFTFQVKADVAYLEDESEIKLTEIAITNGDVELQLSETATTKVTRRNLVVKDFVTLSVAEPVMEVEVGQENDVTVNMANEKEVYGINAVIALPEGLKLADATATGFVKSERIPTGMNFSFNATNNTLVLSSLTNKKIAVGEGAIFTFKVVADETLAETSELKFTNIRVSDAAGSPDNQLDDVTVNVTVKEEPEVVVAEINGDGEDNYYDWIAENVGKTLDVKVTRTLPANQWTAIVLPFTLKGKYLKEAFGGTAPKLAYFLGAENVEDEDGNVTGLDVKFDTETTLYANTPMLIKVGDSYPGYIEAEGVEIEGIGYEPVGSFSASAMQTYLETYFGDIMVPAVFGEGENDIKSRRNSIASANVFIGTYMRVEGIGTETNDYYIKDNKFYHANNAKTKATRGYFMFENSTFSLSNGVRMVFLNDEDGESTTGIESINVVPADNTLYNLQGQRVKNGQKGLLIQNGKKMIIR